PPQKFLVFFDSMKESECAVKYLQQQLPPSLQHKIQYFHSMMTPDYHKDNFNDLRDSVIWGLCATDAFGMGMDIPDIKLVIQWKVSCGLCTLWQRFGHAVQGQGQEGVAILIIEKKNTVEGREEKE
ncbi:P-loop containing nucleoside triphosphate hydrolase protein, partial [Cyathus striatus]